MDYSHPLFIFIITLAVSFIKSKHGGIAFNVDVPSAVVYKGPSGSYFGFSVALHRSSGKPSPSSSKPQQTNVNWLLVGAPLANTIQPGVKQGGQVFRCSPITVTMKQAVIEFNEQCQPIPFDLTGTNESSTIVSSFFALILIYQLELN